MDLGEVASGALNIVSGGLFGVVSSAVQRYGDYKNKQLDMETLKLKYTNELALREVDAKITAAEAEGKYRVAEVEGEARKDVAETDAFRETLFREPGSYLGALQKDASRGEKGAAIVLDFIRGVVRPFITLYLIVLTTLIYFNESDHVSKRYIIDSVLFLSSTAVLHYFGTRNKGKQPKL